MSKKRDRRTVGDSFVIEELSKRIFKSRIPPDWPIRKQCPDIHIDYVIEVVEEGELTGLRFDVQLKGTSRISVSNHGIRHRMGRKSLRYYMKAVREPVYLVVVDVNREIGYWLFLQKWLDENEALEYLKSKNHTSMPITIPENNNLANLSSFLASIHDADAYMREKYPGSIKAAIRTDVAKLESLDPRIRVELDVIKGTKHYSLHPKEDVPLKLGIPASKPSIHSGLKALTEYGQTLNIHCGDLKVSGSPLIEHILNKDPDGEIVMSTMNRWQAALQLSVLTESDERIRLSPGRGYISQGDRGAFFEGVCDNSPLYMSFRLDPSSFLKSKSLSIKMKLRSEEWEREKILDLRGFHMIEELIAATEKSNRLFIECYLKDQFMFSAEGEVRLQDSPLLGKKSLVNFVHNCRSVAQKLGTNPVFPNVANLKKKQIEDVEVLEDLLSGREHISNGQGVKVRIPMFPDLENWRNHIRCGHRYAIGLKLLDNRFMLLDDDVDIGPIIVELTEGVLLSDHQEVIDFAVNNPDKSYVVEFEGFEGARYIVKRDKGS